MAELRTFTTRRTTRAGTTPERVCRILRALVADKAVQDRGIDVTLLAAIQMIEAQEREIAKLKRGQPQ